jgi:hypothetical protein
MSSNALSTLRVRIADSEIEATGTEEFLRERIQEFLKNIPASGKKISPPKLSDDLETGSDEAPAMNNSGNEQVNRLFEDRDGLISLRALPRGANAEAESLLLLLYGYKTIKGTNNVTGVTLMKAAKQSGVNIDRVDRTMGLNTEYVLKAGLRRGVKYSLNNRGVIKAEEVMHEVFQ